MLLSMGKPSNAMGKFPFDAWEQQVVVQPQCPPLKQYSKEKSVKVAKELRELRLKDQKAATPELLRDYGVLRDQCRAIAK